MTRVISPFSAVVLALTGCDDNGDKQPLAIGREFETIEGAGLSAIEFHGPRKIDDDLYAKTILVPPTFISAYGSASQTDPVDPFARPPEDSEPRINPPPPTAQDILENVGVTFSKGHFARYYPEGSALVVVLPRDQLELVEAYMCSLGPDYAYRISLRTEIFEVGENVYRQLLDGIAGEIDHTPEHNALLESVARKESRLVEASSVAASSGARAKIESGETGPKLEADMVLGASYEKIDVRLHLSHSPARHDEDLLSLDAEFTIEPGSYYLAGSWSLPGSNPQLYHVVFVTGNIPLWE